MNNSLDKPIHLFEGIASNGHVLEVLSILVSVFLFPPLGMCTQERSERHRLYGEVKLERGPISNALSVNRNPSFDVILYSLSGNVLGRQSVLNRGPYQFVDVPSGQYDLAIEFQSREIGRTRIWIFASFDRDVRQDLELAWSSTEIYHKPMTVFAGDSYERSRSNQKGFENAQHAIRKKRYTEATSMLKKILADDSNDFQSWTELGTTFLAQSILDEAEVAYVHATELSPTFFVALLDLGRLRLMRKDFVGAIPILLRAVETKPRSADANFYLGEAYLQVKKGSTAVTYFCEALRLDPIGKAEAHLRLALLYNAAGLKDKAAIQYQEFLKKRPDYEDRQTLERYIDANLKSSR
ncbi:MAG TPA: tetratricopeptide repeat protein [Pyrinomonadaceae bacterium]|jgi:Cytochrome c biogenesis factor|nr:tetratricopeptide repeat protein [Pyrinomonadaceae bacterium]